MEARLTGPPPAADSEREKKFQKGTHYKNCYNENMHDWPIYTRHKLYGADITRFVSLGDESKIFDLL